MSEEPFKVKNVTTTIDPDTYSPLLKIELLWQLVKASDDNAAIETEELERAIGKAVLAGIKAQIDCTGHRLSR